MLCCQRLSLSEAAVLLPLLLRPVLRRLLADGVGDSIFLRLSSEELALVFFYPDGSCQFQTTRETSCRAQKLFFVLRFDGKQKKLQHRSCTPGPGAASADRETRPKLAVKTGKDRRQTGNGNQITINARGKWGGICIYSLSMVRCRQNLLHQRAGMGRFLQP